MVGLSDLIFSLLMFNVYFRGNVVTTVLQDPKVHLDPRVTEVMMACKEYQAPKVTR
jgi:hypothetical protein